MGGTSVGGAKGAGGEGKSEPQGQLAATTTSLEAAARLAVCQPGARQLTKILYSLITWQALPVL